MVIRRAYWPMSARVLIWSSLVMMTVGGLVAQAGDEQCRFIRGLDQCDGNGLMRASYFEPAKDEAVELAGCSVDNISSLLGVILGLSSKRGHPTLELVRGDGSSLALSTDGTRAYLVFVNSLGESFHSTGGSGGESMVFDYFGSWSEAPASSLVSLEYAQQCAEAFALTGTADTDRVLFEPD
jgi:hypothetical protein